MDDFDTLFGTEEEYLYNRQKRLNQNRQKSANNVNDLNAKIQNNRYAENNFEEDLFPNLFESQDNYRKNMYFQGHTREFEDYRTANKNSVKRQGIMGVWDRLEYPPVEYDHLNILRDEDNLEYYKELFEAMFTVKEKKVARRLTQAEIEEIQKESLKKLQQKLMDERSNRHVDEDEMEIYNQLYINSFEEREKNKGIVADIFVYLFLISVFIFSVYLILK